MYNVAVTKYCIWKFVDYFNIYSQCAAEFRRNEAEIFGIACSYRSREQPVMRASTCSHMGFTTDVRWLRRKNQLQINYRTSEKLYKQGHIETDYLFLTILYHRNICFINS